MTKETQHMSEHSQRLEQVRGVLGLTKTAFAQKLGVSQQTYLNYSNGRSPNIEFVSNVSTTYGVNGCWLLTGEGEMFPNATASEPDIDQHESEIEELKRENHELKQAIEELKSNTPLTDVELLADLNNATKEIIALNNERRELQNYISNLQSQINSGQSNPNYEKVVKQYADLLKEYKKLKAHIQQASDNNLDKEELPLPPEEWPDLIPDPQKIKTVVIEPIPKDSDNKTDTNDHSKAKKIIKK